MRASTTKQFDIQVNKSLEKRQNAKYLLMEEYLKPPKSSEPTRLGGDTYISKLTGKENKIDRASMEIARSTATLSFLNIRPQDVLDQDDPYGFNAFN